MSQRTQRVAYARVSSAGQNLDRQIEALGEVDKIYREYQSAASASERPVLREAIDYVRDGDTLAVASIDRLARSLRDMLTIMEELEDKGVTVEFVSQGLTIRPDEGDLTTRLILHIVTAVAQSEREMLRERQAEGIAIAKQLPGKYPGRKRLLNSDQIREVRNAAAVGVPKAQIARKYDISRSTLYRYLEQPTLPMRE
ncbi:MAG: recombinase family protein [Brevibacterium aurantiacum]|uniref:recombinase family protein n=1 Tax=Brachybacterium alimentarium TaxID=47845 RepID=UPI000DF12D4B|nr:recombinase family protein [Brachybacterium alimentarium]MDN5601261.1 recombinase family protein [Brachybacterium sp.]MDN6301544.1 recombinase family protein [Brachybacterium sp.]MDN6372765.1 recombinase family protein [Brevibacterium aurantiacum]RCS68775.1 recombinase family protein [Brachybacterium alimentarium]